MTGLDLPKLTLNKDELPRAYTAESVHCRERTLSSRFALFPGAGVRGCFMQDEVQFLGLLGVCGTGSQSHPHGAMVGLLGNLPSRVVQRCFFCSIESVIQNVSLQVLNPSD